MIPKVEKEELGFKPIDWTGFTKRYLNPNELETIVALVQGAKNVLEIGCNEGRTAAAILRECESVKNYVGIDVPKGYTFAKHVQKNEVPDQAGHMAAHDKRFKLFLSERGSFDYKGKMKFDAIFIDGDHGEEAVKHDTKMAFELIREGGVIIWHDYHNIGTVDVKKCLDEFYADGMPIKHVNGTWIAFCKVDECKQAN